MTVRETRFRYEGEDGVSPAGLFRRSGAAPSGAGVVQLAHGAIRPALRGPLAPIVEAGRDVVRAVDHRGHGLTCGMASSGDFGPGGQAAVRDMEQSSPPRAQCRSSRICP